MKSLSRLLRPDACHQHVWGSLCGQGMPGDLGSLAAEPCKAGPRVAWLLDGRRRYGSVEDPEPEAQREAFQRGPAFSYTAAVGGSRGYGAAGSFVVFSLGHEQLPLVRGDWAGQILPGAEADCLRWSPDAINIYLSTIYIHVYLDV